MMLVLSLFLALFGVLQLILGCPLGLLDLILAAGLGGLMVLDTLTP